MMLIAALTLLTILLGLCLVALGQPLADRLDPDRLDRIADTRAREGVPPWQTS